MSDALRRVFLSYARADSTSFVDRLEQDLKAQQFVPWVDRHGLEGGEEWMEIIQQAIDECLALVVVLSPAAMQSQFVRMEYRYAAKQGKIVIPALHIAPPRTPMDLDILQWVDFQASYEEGLRQLAQALSRLKGAAPAPAPAPAKPIIQPPPAPATPSKTKEQWIDVGNTHRRNKRYEEALAAYNNAIQIDPQYANAYLGRGNAHWYLKRHNEA
ncbi:MAG TPA: TIR domain-containing protein, partial [Ktedonobacterales bacterium]